MDYRDGYRHYDRSAATGFDGANSGYKQSIEDVYAERARKRGRSPSPTYDRYSSDRRMSGYAPYPAADPWERDRETSPYASRSGYDDYRDVHPYDRDHERTRAMEWERYYRGRDEEYRNGKGHPDRERYEARMRFDDEGMREREERFRSRERERPHGYSPSYPEYMRGGPEPGSDALSIKRSTEPITAPDPMQSETLLVFRAYAQMVKAGHPSARDRSIEPPSTQELYDGYQAYRLAFAKKAMVVFFEQKRDEVWFKEKYSTSDDLVEARQRRRRAGRAGRKQSWLEELESAKLDHLDFDLKVSRPSDDALVSENGKPADSKQNNGDKDNGIPSAKSDSKLGKEPEKMALTSRYGQEEVLSGEQVNIPASETQILIKSFPPDLSREKLEDHLRTRQGFRYVALGEPHSGKKWHRVGWAVYQEGTDMEETLKALDGKEIDNFTLHLGLSSRPTSGKLRTVPEYANSFARLLFDLNHVKQLVLQLENEDRNVLFKEEAEANIQSGSKTWLETDASASIMKRHKEMDPDLNEEDLEKEYDSQEDPVRREQRRSRLKKHLDLHLDLLRTVYNCDYYLSLTCDFQEELLRRSPRHVRKQPAAGTLVEEPRENTNDESWAKSVTQKTNLLLSDEKADLSEFGGKNVEGEMLNAALPFVKEEEKEKHRCIVETNGNQCGKLFKAIIFVQKHVLNKHRSFLESAAADIINEARYFNNYVHDPCRTQPPILHGSAPSANVNVSTTPLAQRLVGGFEPTVAVPSPLFNVNRVGLIRLGNSTAAADPGPPSYPPRDRRGTSPGRRMGNAAHGSLPVILGMYNALPMNMGSFSNPVATSLGMRIGGMANEGSESSTRNRSSVPDVVKPVAEPLPPPPKPLDPRAIRAAPKSYQDLDGPAGGGDVDDLAY